MCVCVCVLGRGWFRAGHLVSHCQQEARETGTWRRKGSGTRSARSEGCSALGKRTTHPLPFPLSAVNSLPITIRNVVTTTKVVAITVEVNHRGLALTSPCATTAHGGENSSS